MGGIQALQLLLGKNGNLRKRGANKVKIERLLHLTLVNVFEEVGVDVKGHHKLYLCRERVACCLASAFYNNIATLNAIGNQPFESSLIGSLG